MTLEKFLTILSISFGFIATGYFIYGVLKMTPHIIGELSSSKFDYNVDLLNNYCSQRTGALVGIFFLIFALFLQFGSQIPATGIIHVSKSALTSILCFVGMVVISIVVSYGINRSLYTNIRFNTGKHMLSSIINGNERTLENVDYIEKAATSLIYFERFTNEDDKTFLERLLKELDLKKP